MREERTNLDNSYYDKRWLLERIPYATSTEQQAFTERVSEFVGRGCDEEEARILAYEERYGEDYL